MICSSFPPEQCNAVEVVLASITLDHVMARSPLNLINTRRSVLHLAKGDLEKIEYYAKRAKEDFRDVIYWASEEQKAKE